MTKIFNELIEMNWSKCREALLEKEIPEHIINDFKLIYLAGMHDVAEVISKFARSVASDAGNIVHGMPADQQTEFLQKD